MRLIKKAVDTFFKTLRTGKLHTNTTNVLCIAFLILVYGIAGQLDFKAEVSSARMACEEQYGNIALFVIDQTNKSWSCHQKMIIP